ncbi:MAG: ISKra4 family transposase [Treponema sp.]|nr:ISKra4 family transposase [Treponema sp.]
MESKIIKTERNSITVQVTIPLSEEMLSTEEAIQQGVNQAGLIATEYALSRFDTDGTPIKVGKKKYTSKGQQSKTYQCPFGEFELCRHVYQSNEGGSTYCPLDNDARILVYSTPKFSKMVSQKYSQFGSRQVQKDLKENHGRFISHTYIQDISSAVGDVALNNPWKYSTGVYSSDVSTIGISLDGTCMLLRQDGWRQAMVGSVSLYDKTGERLHTTYIAQAPEYGKETFFDEFTKEIETIKKNYQGKTYIGVADGAPDNWTFLNQFVDVQVLDFYHATEYLTKVSKAAFKRKFEGTEWLKQSCHVLKHETDGAKTLLKEMEKMIKKKITIEKKEQIETAITYFTNHLTQMNYSDYLSKNIPIGSGVIEAACKVIIKQRMCNSGMRWTEDGAKKILVLRCFNETDGRWKQFWDKITKMGY